MAMYPNFPYYYTPHYVEQNTLVPAQSIVAYKNYLIKTGTGNRLSELMDINKIIDELIAKDLTIILKQSIIYTGFVDVGTLRGLKFDHNGPVSATLAFQPGRSVAIPDVAYKTFDNCLVVVFTFEIHSFPIQDDVILSIDSPSFKSVKLVLARNNTIELTCLNTYRLLPNLSKKIQVLCFELKNIHLLVPTILISLNEKLVVHEPLLGFDKKLGFSPPMVLSSQFSSWTLHNFEVFTGDELSKEKFSELCDFERFKYVNSVFLESVPNTIDIELTSNTTFPVPFGFAKLESVGGLAHDLTRLRRGNGQLICDMGIMLSWFRLTLNFELFENESSPSLLTLFPSQPTEIKIKQQSDKFIIASAQGDVLSVDKQTNVQTHWFEIEYILSSKIVRIEYNPHVKVGGTALIPATAYIVAFKIGDMIYPSSNVYLNRICLVY